MKPPFLTDDNMDSLLAGFNPSRLSFIAVGATSCAVCHTTAPFYKALAEELADQADFYRCNADRTPSVIERLNLQSIPTMLAYRGQTEVSRLTQITQPSDFKNWIAAVLADNA